MADSPRTYGSKPILMRDDYLQAALKIIDDPNILVNVVSRRVKQLKRGNRPLVVSLEKLTPEELARSNGGPAPHSVHNAVFKAA